MHASDREKMVGCTSEFSGGTDIYGITGTDRGLLDRQSRRVLSGQSGRTGGNSRVIFRKKEQTKRIRSWTSEPVPDSFRLSLRKRDIR